VPRKEMNRQPISKLLLISSMIDGLLDKIEKQSENLRSLRATALATPKE
jgi:hypothetical protein